MSGIFRLNKEQEAIAFLTLERARIDYEAGKPGIVIAQIAYNEKKNNVFCHFEYIENNRANLIKDILALE